LHINGGGKTNADGTYIVTAPRSGYVVEKLINPGNFIRNDNSSNLFTIGDISDVWIWANVYETDVAKVKEGYTASVSAIAYPDSVFIGKVDKLNEVLDPVTKIMKAKIVLPNKDGLLKPEMFANIIVSNTEGKQMIAVPAGALINDNQKTFVIVFVDSNNVSIRPVAVSKTVNNYAYITTGLQAGEKVITQNQILIYKKLQDINNSK
jgi:cobalt-zinc-cadmium efflux system membrane fusion protein